MMICYDKAFPESARALALDGAEIIVCVSAWPGSRTNAPADLAEDRWTRRFDLFDRARALENQVVWVSANQSGTFGSLRFVCSAKVVDPGGDVLADHRRRAPAWRSPTSTSPRPLDDRPPLDGPPARPPAGRVPDARSACPRHPTTAWH